MDYHNVWGFSGYFISRQIWFITKSESESFFYLSTIRSNVRLRRQSVRPFSPSSTSRPQGTQGNIITRVGASLRRRPGYVPYPGDRGMDGEGGWGPQTKRKSQMWAEGDRECERIVFPNINIAYYSWSGCEIKGFLRCNPMVLFSFFLSSLCVKLQSRALKPK